MKKKDICLIAVIVIAALFLYIWIAHWRSTEGNMLRVSVKGEVYGEYSLSEDQTIEIETDLGTNRLTIRDGYAVMTEADCPDGYCVEQGKISKNTQTIICLPHKVVAEVYISGEASESEENIDAIVK